MTRNSGKPWTAKEVAELTAEWRALFARGVRVKDIKDGLAERYGRTYAAISTLGMRLNLPTSVSHGGGVERREGGGLIYPPWTRSGHLPWTEAEKAIVRENWLLWYAQGVPVKAIKLRLAKMLPGRTVAAIANRGVTLGLPARDPQGAGRGG